MKRYKTPWSQELEAAVPDKRRPSAAMDEGYQLALNSPQVQGLVQALEDSQGEWLSVTTTYAPEHLHPAKDALEAFYEMERPVVSLSDLDRLVEKIDALVAKLPVKPNGWITGSTSEKGAV